MSKNAYLSWKVQRIETEKCPGVLGKAMGEVRDYD